MRTLLFTAFLTSSCAFAGAPSTQLAAPVSANQAEAVFAGGCFWCIETDFEKLKGVIGAESGYTGGKVKGPSYKQVSMGLTEHLEGIRVIYDPKKVSYKELVHYFFRHIDPTQTDGQFCDRGPHYTTAIFTRTDEERSIALAEKELAEKELKKTVVTPVRAASEFWLAEDYHQDYYLKNPAHYARYRKGCRRDAQVHQLWGSTH